MRLHRVERARLTAAAAAGQLYAVLDACVGPSAIALVEALGPDRASCLYLGQAAENYADKAPYLLRVDPALLDDLATRFGSMAWGCLVVSTQAPDLVRRHLRGWLTVSSPEGAAWLFRFWDPRLLPTFLRASTAAELDAFFGPLTAFATVGDDGDAFVAERQTASPPARRPAGARHAISPAQVTALRRSGFADRLVAGFDGTAQIAIRDRNTGDVLLRAGDGNTTRLRIGDDGLVGGIVSPAGRRWSMAHREDGKLARLTLPSGAVLSIGYDAAGNVARVDRGETERFRAIYDRLGRVEHIAFPDGSDARTAYASQGTEALADPNGDLVAARRDRAGRTERFGYNGHRLIEAVDGGNNVTSFLHDDAGRPAATVFADHSRETYDYDARDKLATIVRASGARLEVACDDAGRPVRTQAADGAIANFAYDDAGRLIFADDGTTALAWTYDDAGRLIEERQGDASVGYAYDATGLAGIRYPDGSIVRIAHDGDGRLASLTDWNGGQHRFDYADGDAGWRQTSPGGLVTTHWNNPVGLTTATRVERSGATLWEASYGWDDDDRLRTRSDTRLGDVAYSYDPEGQLLAESDRGGTVEQFAYDGAGNRTHCGAGQAQYDALNRLIAQGSTRYAYDADGNMVERLAPGATWRFRYDGRGRLVEASGDGERRVTFGYDPLGRRLWKRVEHAGSISTTRFVWAGETVIHEVCEDAAGSRTRDYVFAPGTYTPLLLRQSGTIYQYHVNPGGMPTLLTAQDGGIVWEADGRAYGSLRSQAGTIPQPWRLPGQYADDELGLGLHYNRFRYYDPAIGRYISRDPIGVAGGLNLYTYAGNDPVNRADPLGLWWKAALSVVAAVAVAAIVVATAPLSAPLLIIAAGAAAGAAGFMVNEALNQETFCLSCILLAGLKGAGVGALASLPFVFLPLSAGVGLYMAAGAGSGFLGYAGEWAVTPGMEWSWADAAKATAIGAASGGLGRYLGGKFAPRKPASSPPAAASAARPDAFAGVKEASAYLKSMGVDRATRVQVLQSFERGTITKTTAGDNLFGTRFHDFGKTARPEGQYLFETFTPQTNRAGLALPPEWNGMTGIKQFQIKPGTTVLRGRAGPQFDYGPQYTGGAEQMFVLQPWKYGSLL